MAIVGNLSLKNLFKKGQAMAKAVEAKVVQESGGIKTHTGGRGVNALRSNLHGTPKSHLPQTPSVIRTPRTNLRSNGWTKAQIAKKEASIWRPGELPEPNYMGRVTSRPQFAKNLGESRRDPRGFNWRGRPGREIMPSPDDHIFTEIHHGTASAWPAEANFPHGRARLDLIENSPNGIGQRTKGIGLYLTGVDTLAEGYTMTPFSELAQDVSQGKKGGLVPSLNPTTYHFKLPKSVDDSMLRGSEKIWNQPEGVLNAINSHPLTKSVYDEMVADKNAFLASLPDGTAKSYAGPYYSFDHHMDYEFRGNKFLERLSKKLQASGVVLGADIHTKHKASLDALGGSGGGFSNHAFPEVTKFLDHLGIPGLQSPIHSLDFSEAMGGESMKQELVLWNQKVLDQLEHSQSPTYHTETKNSLIESGRIQRKRRLGAKFGLYNL